MLLVYDVCDRSSFDSLDSWLAELNQHSGTNIKNIIVVLCANKVL